MSEPLKSLSPPKLKIMEELESPDTHTPALPAQNRYEGAMAVNNSTDQVEFFALYIRRSAGGLDFPAHRSSELASVYPPM